MDLSVPYKIAKDQKEAFALAKVQITPEYVAKFNVKADITYNESALTMEAKGKGFTLTLCFINGECEVSIKLSLLLRALKGKILGKIENKLERHV